MSTGYVASAYMTNGELLTELHRRAKAIGAKALQDMVERAQMNVSGDVLNYRPALSDPPEAVTELQAVSEASEPPRNGFSVEAGGMSVSFDAVAPNMTDGLGPKGYIPTPDDLVSVIEAMNRADYRDAMLRNIALYLFGETGDHMGQMYAGRAFTYGPAERRIGRLEETAAEADKALREMMRNQQALGRSTMDNQTSISERLAAVERALGQRDAEDGTHKMMWSNVGETAPPPSAEQVAAAERGEPQGGTVTEAQAKAADPSMRPEVAQPEQR